MNKDLVNLFNIDVYSDTENEAFVYDLGLDGEYHKAVLNQNCSIHSVVVSLLLGFVMSYCEDSHLSFDDEVERAIDDYVTNTGVDLTWNNED